MKRSLNRLYRRQLHVKLYRIEKKSKEKNIENEKGIQYKVTSQLIVYENCMIGDLALLSFQ